MRGRGRSKEKGMVLAMQMLIHCLNWRRQVGQGGQGGRAEAEEEPRGAREAWQAGGQREPEVVVQGRHTSP